MAYTKYSLTPANNNAVPPDGAPEGMLPSAVNDTMRDMMAQIRDCGDGIRGGTYTMTAPVITGGSINGAAIGASSASTGSFTTLAYTGTLTGGTGVVNLGSGQFYKDASGNIGINGAPNAWSRKAVQITDAAEGYYSSNVRTALTCNYYFDGTGKYIQNGYAAFYDLSSVTGSHIWYTTASGTTGGTVTLNQAMILTSGNQLGIGKNPAVTLDVNGAINCDPNITLNGLNVVYRATYNDNTSRQLSGVGWADAFGVFTIKGTGGTALIPWFGNGGAGVAYRATALDPDAGTWVYSDGPSITFTTGGTGGNTFSLSFNGGSGTFTLQRTAGSGSFTVIIQHFAT